MTDREHYQALPKSERDELGFAQWRQQQHIGTHGPECWMGVQALRACALDEIVRLNATLKAVRLALQEPGKPEGGTGNDG